MRITEFQNYRVYLQAFYLHRKRSLASGYTYAQFAKEARIKSPNYLKLVIDGKRGLTSENIVKFSKALQLDSDDRDYFEALVQFNQAKSPIEREFYQDRLSRISSRVLRSNQQLRTLQEYEFEAISSWLHHAVLTLASFKRFVPRPEWISARLQGQTTPSEVASILETLIRIGALEQQVGGKLKRVHRQLKTQPELARDSAKQFYMGLLARATKSLTLTPSDQREFGAYLVGLSPEQIPELKRRVRTFLSELNEWALENSQPNQVYALSFFGFPLSTSEDQS